MAERVVVFIDYQNLHGWARRLFYGHGAAPSQGHVDPLRLGQYLCKVRAAESQLKEVRVYRGRPNPERQPGATRANDRQTSAWQRSPLVTVHRRNLAYPDDWPDTPASEKGIDVAIAVDMMRLAMTPGYMDAAILFSSDTDLLPALEAIWELRLCKLEVASWQRGYRLRFHDSALPWCHSIGKDQYRTLVDDVDYSAPIDPSDGTGWLARMSGRQR